MTKDLQGESIGVPADDQQRDVIETLHSRILVYGRDWNGYQKEFC